MSRLRNFLIPFGLAAGATAFITAWWIRQGRVNRSALASNAEELTWQALRQLNVAAEARAIPVNGLELHTIVAGPLDGPLVILLHGFPECWYSCSLDTTASHPEYSAHMRSLAFHYQRRFHIQQLNQAPFSRKHSISLV